MLALKYRLSVSAIMARDIPGAASSPTTAVERITWPAMGAFSTAFSAITPATEPMSLRVQGGRGQGGPQVLASQHVVLGHLVPFLDPPLQELPDDLGAHGDHVRGYPRVIG